ncbi:MAG TPA: hypothetical protein VFD61_09015 [Gaiellales bacterium]|jgi:hypothetical protein|nr:hypothetical protein [Gaiellales bacterium]
MPEARPSTAAPGFYVFRRVGEDRWQLIGEAARRPGLTARKARAQAIADAVGGQPGPGEAYAAVLRSEWRIALEY